MTNSKIRRAACCAVVGLALAGIGNVAPAAGTANTSPVSLYLEDPDGNAFRLVRVEGAGWTYVEGWKERGNDSFFRKVLLGSKPAAPAAEALVESDGPLTVFIDGPSGFTYVWYRDEGWKFVGKIAGRKP
jgi:hypothetical protein